MRKVHGPEDLVTLAMQGWQAKDGFPAKDHVTFIASELFRLSLAVDEGRYPRLLFAFLGRQLHGHAFVPLGDEYQYLSDIISLAPALAPPPFAIVLSGEEIARCDGIVNLEQAPLVPGIYFGVRGPGELELMVYREHDRNSWHLSKGACRKITSLGDSELVKKLCTRVAAKASDYHGDDVAEILKNLVYTVSRLQHGGALLISDTELSGTTSTLDFGTRPFALLPPDTAAVKGTQLDVATILACLSQIDGAMVFTSKLELRAVGVFLKHKTTNVVPTSGRYAGEEIEMGKLALGSRHRSAAWFCKSNPDATAIVVSQDRAIRVFGHDHETERVLLEGPFIDLLTPS